MRKVTIEELRQWLKVPEGKLVRWQDLRRFVLEPAIRQMNSSPDGAGFTVTMQPQKKGRSIYWVLFEVIKTKERDALEVKLLEREKPPELFAVRLRLATYKDAKRLAPGWDVYALEAEWKAWGPTQPDWPPQHPDAAFLGLCKRRGSSPR